MDDRDVEQLLTRYRPAGPSSSLDGRIGHLAAMPPRQSPRVWPWAAAAAALLALTAGFHSPARTSAADSLNTDPIFRDAVSALSTQLGGDATARMLADTMLRQEAAEREQQQAASGRR